MAYLPFEIIRLTRPVHWVKNLSLFAALVFSGLLFSQEHFLTVVVAFIAFGLASSATYIFNDILDRKKDRLHPIKQNRPIAKGTVSVYLAIFMYLVLAFSALWIASFYNLLFFASIVIYLILQVAYSLYLKHIAVIDILVIASGFILRVYSGAFVIDAHLSVWFLLCVISVALFLASGKRRTELGIVEETQKTTRESLMKYSRPLLDAYVTMFGNAAWMSWALFTFFESPEASINLWTMLAEISRTTTVSKILMGTIPFAIFAVMRYQSLIFENKSEAPERLLLSDSPLVADILIWGLLVVWILYGGIAVA